MTGVQHRIFQIRKFYCFIFSYNENNNLRIPGFARLQKSRLVYVTGAGWIALRAAAHPFGDQPF